MHSDELQLAVDLGRDALVVALKLSLPILAAGLVVGVVISVLQAATQVQDQTLSFVPKMIAIVAVIFLMMPWLLAILVEYTHEVVTDMGSWFR